MPRNVILFCLLFGLFVSAALLPLEGRIGLFLSVFFLGLIWIEICIDRPLLAFSILLLVFVLAYTRLRISLFEVPGGVNRGKLALGDILWFVLIVTWYTKSFLSRRPIKYSLKFPGSIWVMLPFVALAVFLPIIGVIAGNWPLNYAIPGMRQIQWASFAILAYSLCNKHEAHRVLSVIFGTMIFAAVGHLIYALIQLGYFLGILGRWWVVLDDLFAAHNKMSWFFYPRLTGLQVNPNSYGLFSAFILVIVLAMSFARTSNQRPGLWWIGSVSGIFGLVFSGSRSAFLGLMAAFFVWVFLSLANHRLLLRGLLFGAKTTVVGISAFFVMLQLLPQRLQGRFVNLFDVFSIGVNADKNLILRVEEWHRLLDVYLNDFPFGTWVPSSYAANSPVDSFYMFTMIQGTAIFTMTWLLFLGGAIVLGWHLYLREVKCVRMPIVAVCGLVLSGWAVAFAVSSLTLTPMLQPQLIVPFWIIIGIVVALRRCY